MRIKKNEIVPDTKGIIKTHIATKKYYNYSEKTIKKDYNNIPLQNRNNVKTKCEIYELQEGRFTLTI